LRREGYPNPYEVLKDLTRINHRITPEVIAIFVQGLDVSEIVKKELQSITPQSYTGIY
jgi:adenylosuccinate lyase